LTSKEPKKIEDIPPSHRLTSQLTPLLSWFQNAKWLPWTVLAVSLAMTFELWQIEQRDALDELENNFDFQVREDVLVIKQRMRAYEQVLRGAEALFVSSTQVENEQFLHYVATLRLQENYPGILGMSFAQLTTPTSPAVQAQAFAPRKQEDALGDTLVATTPDKSYIPITYRELFLNNNTRSFSFDSDSEPFRRAAMEHARDEGVVAISGKVRLLAKDNRTHSGFVMYLPIYKNGSRHQTVAQRRDSLIGWVTAPFLMDDLMTTKAGGPKERDIEIYDGEKVSGQTLLFDTDAEALSGNAWNAGGFKTIQQIRVADRTWTIAIRSLPPFEARLNKKTTQVVGSTGLGISLLLTLLTWVLIGSRSRALEAARRMNRELIEQEMRYRQMFENNAASAVLVDPASGSIIDANPAAEAFWGYSLPQLRGMNISEINTASPAALHATMQQVKHGLVTSIEQQHRLRNGEIRDVEIYSGPVTYQGKTFLYSLLHDITSRKRAEHAMRSSEERYRLIADNTGDVIWMMDVASFTFTYISPSIERQRGFTPEEVIALYKKALLSPPTEPLAKSLYWFRGQLQERIQRYMAGDESQRREVLEIKQPHKNGTLVPLEVVSTLLCNDQGVPITVVGVSRDISARRQAQEEQSRFMSMVSHEFRTPLATIDGAIQRLEATAGDIDAATRKRYRNIQKAVDRLTALLDDYLTQERMDTLGQGLQLHFFPPQALLLDSQAAAQAVSTDHLITVELSGLPDKIRCDSDRLRLTLHVLVDNAVKYTPPGAHIRICGNTPEKGGIEFVVADNGPGIPEDEMPQIFTKFFRGRHSARETGSGLGLYLARSVVELHGGTLTVCNGSAGGAEFRIWLPSNPAASRA
jgi:PAS domain S-box-containing protein